ncbi:hypothetical protein ID866_8509 [Astraeus odoratus]|nr:hypothetical protein ID866_8509 [Astraeus odoratus]
MGMALEWFKPDLLSSSDLALSGV